MRWQAIIWIKTWPSWRNFLSERLPLSGKNGSVDLPDFGVGVGTAFFLIGQYRKYGSFLKWRAVVIYSFVFYLLAAYFLIILPLPSRESVAQLTTQRYNLIPFTALREFINTTVFSPLHPSTWLTAMKQPGFIQPVFNIVLTIPFGVYLRYYFKRPWWQAWLMSLGLSLFFELTQLSGLYGYYPRPYRLFDVDDLILNSTGGLIGALIAPVLMHAFPTREKMDQQSLQAGTRVSLMRRFVAFFLDNVVVVGIAAAVLGLISNLLGMQKLLPGVLLTWVLPVFFFPCVSALGQSWCHLGQTAGEDPSGG